MDWMFFFGVEDTEDHIEDMISAKLTKGDAFFWKRNINNKLYFWIIHP